MKTLHKFLPLGLALSGLLLSAAGAEAIGISDSARVRGGILACGGNHFSRLGGEEQHRTVYVLHNFSGKGTISIDSFRLYDANGDVLFGYPSVDLPPSVKTELGPHETTQINTADLLEADLGPANRPIQAHIGWSFGPEQRGLALDGSIVRTVRAISGEERSRANSACKLIHYRR